MRSEIIRAAKWTDLNGTERQAPASYAPIVYGPARNWCIECRRLRVCYCLAGFGDAAFCGDCTQKIGAPITRPAWPSKFALNARVSYQDAGRQDRRYRR